MSEQTYTTYEAEARERDDLPRVVHLRSSVVDAPACGSRADRLHKDCPGANTPYDNSGTCHACGLPTCAMCLVEWGLA